MEMPDQNVVNAGIVFMFTVWLQGQMSDLLVAHGNPDLVPQFVANPDGIPEAFHRQRVANWARDFGQVKSEFVAAFSGQLTTAEIRDLEQVYLLRNAIGHAHVSMARNYMLYRPSNAKREKAVLEAFGLEERPDSSCPTVLKLEFWRPDRFGAISNLIERIDQSCFSRIASSVGIPHGRIR